MAAGRFIAICAAFPLLSGCASVADLVSGPDPLTYEPHTAAVFDQAQYKSDLALCRKALAKTPSGFSSGDIAVAGGKAAVSDAPAAAASVPFYGVQIGAAVGSEALDQATGSRLPRMAAFMSCLRQITTQDRSAVLADSHQ